MVACFARHELTGSLISDLHTSQSMGRLDLLFAAGGGLTSANLSELAGLLEWMGDVVVLSRTGCVQPFSNHQNDDVDWWRFPETQPEAH